MHKIHESGEAGGRVPPSPEPASGGGAPSLPSLASISEAAFQRMRLRALSAPRGQKKRRMKALQRARTKMLKAEVGRG